MGSSHLKLKFIVKLLEKHIKELSGAGEDGQVHSLMNLCNMAGQNQLC